MKLSDRVALHPASEADIDTAGTPEEIIGVIKTLVRDAVADRLAYLYDIVEEDPDEPPMDIDSLRAMALFLISERELPDPQIGVNPDGLVQTQWRVPSGGLLAMEFLPMGLIRFAAVSEPATPGVERQRFSGALPKAETLDAVQPFTASL